MPPWKSPASRGLSIFLGSTHMEPRFISSVWFRLCLCTDGGRPSIVPDRVVRVGFLVRLHVRAIIGRIEIRHVVFNFSSASAKLASIVAAISDRSGVGIDRSVIRNASRCWRQNGLFRESSAFTLSQCPAGGMVGKPQTASAASHYG